MVELKALGKLVKKTILTIVGIEDESTVDTQVLRIDLAEQIEAVGSIPLPDGGKMKRKDNVVYVAQPKDQEEGAITKFLKSLPENIDEVFETEGSVKVEVDLKMDVSKPKFNRNGEVIANPKIWLTEVRFAQGAGALIQANRKTRTDAIISLFSGVKAEEKTETKPSVSATAKDNLVTN